MRTPVRFYITQSDDQPVVRTIPVAVRGEVKGAEQAPSPARIEAQAREAAPRKMTERVRSMVKRAEKVS